MALAPIFKKAYWTLAAAGLVYVLALFALTYPTIQRLAIYAHKVNPTYFQDINDVEQYGFMKGQVQPFNLTTPDGETIYCWHILPLHLYYEHELTLVSNPPSGPVNGEALTQTPAFKLLAEDPSARVIVNFHGNAAALPSALRPTIYQSLLSHSTPTRPIHLLTLDYRGFGLSTGTPTEAGLTTDALSLLTHITSTLSISPRRILLIGQSLGTAVATAVASHFATENLPGFAGVIVAAPFRSIPQLLSGYSIKGLAPPLLSPLRPYPQLQRYFLSHIVDTWNTSARITHLISPENRQDRFNLNIIHARDDWEIPWLEGRGLWDAVVSTSDANSNSLMSKRSESATGKVIVEVGFAELGSHEIKLWQSTDEKRTVRWERVRYGGHNKVTTFAPVGLAVLRAFDDGG